MAVDLSKDEGAKLAHLPLYPGKIHHNLPVPRLIEAAVQQGEGYLANNGAISLKTGKYTGRSPKDKFIVKEPSSQDKIAWGKVNQPMEQASYERLFKKMKQFFQGREAYVFDGFAGADPLYRMPVRFITQYAWHNLFVHQLFIRPTPEQLSGIEPEFTVIQAPDLLADPETDGTNSETFIVIHFAERIALIGGTHYAGELKKSIFTILNYYLPQQNVMPMHCSANVGAKGDVALFFGLSGTGKTTLSADPLRRLIGDDEHGWSDRGIFNFEGGCYAKCINLSAEKEPQIWNAIRFGTVLENVVVDEATRETDFDDATLTENTRAAYPVDYIPGAVIPGIGGHPSTILFLTADAFGVLPPIAKLDKNQAMYHFLSGYTSKLAGTERGVTEPEATFSTCFGEPFLPLQPVEYARMLGNCIDKHQVRVYLVNTGWTGGPYGVGKRMNLAYTRAMVRAAINGDLDQVPYERDERFGFLVPKSCPEVPAEILQARATWADPKAYDEKADQLARRFVENFKRFQSVEEEILQAGPLVS